MAAQIKLELIAGSADEMIVEIGNLAQALAVGQVTIANAEAATVKLTPAEQKALLSPEEEEKPAPKKATRKKAAAKKEEPTEEKAPEKTADKEERPFTVMTLDGKPFSSYKTEDSAFTQLEAIIKELDDTDDLNKVVSFNVDCVSKFSPDKQDAFHNLVDDTFTALENAQGGEADAEESEDGEVDVEDKEAVKTFTLGFIARHKGGIDIVRAEAKKLGADGFKGIKASDYPTFVSALKAHDEVA